MKQCLCKDINNRSRRLLPLSVHGKFNMCNNYCTFFGSHKANIASFIRWLAIYPSNYIHWELQRGLVLSGNWELVTALVYRVVSWGLNGDDVEFIGRLGCCDAIFSCFLSCVAVDEELLTSCEDCLVCNVRNLADFLTNWLTERPHGRFSDW